MKREQLRELLARRMYEKRHDLSVYPSWEQLQTTVKTYKPKKYRDLADAVLDSLAERGLLTI